MVLCYQAKPVDIMYKYLKTIYLQMIVKAYFIDLLFLVRNLLSKYPRKYPNPIYPNPKTQIL